MICFTALTLTRAPQFRGNAMSWIVWEIHCMQEQIQLILFQGDTPPQTCLYSVTCNIVPFGIRRLAQDIIRGVEEKVNN